MPSPIRNDSYPITRLPPDRLMPYPEALVQPMRAELTRLGFDELRTADDVDAAFEAAEEGTTLLVINSVCGCAAAMARPAVAMSRQAPHQPDRSITVFAGQDLEATARTRSFLAGIPPSSPFMALLKDGEPVYVIERRHIEGRSASAIASDLVYALNKYCGSDAEATGEFEQPALPELQDVIGSRPRTFRSIL